jgi:SPW repeat
MATHGRTRTRSRAPYDRRPAQVRPRADDPLYDVPPPAAPPPAPNWRDDVLSLSGLNVLAGIWLIIAPWVLNYRAGDPKWNDVVFGAIVGLLALAKIGGALRASWLSIVNAVIGVWLFVAAFTIDSSWTAGWNDIILGVIVFVLAIASASASERRTATPMV